MVVQMIVNKARNEIVTMVVARLHSYGSFQGVIGARLYRLNPQKLDHNSKGPQTIKYSQQT